MTREDKINELLKHHEKVLSKSKDFKIACLIGTISAVLVKNGLTTNEEFSKLNELAIKECTEAALLAARIELEKLEDSKIDAKYFMMKMYRGIGEPNETT